MAPKCLFCQRDIDILNGPKTCPTCGTQYCTRGDCGIGLWHKCPVCQAKPQLLAIKKTLNQPSYSVRFVTDNQNERIGVLLETSIINPLTNYITAVFHKNNPERRQMLELLKPSQYIVDGKGKKHAVIISSKRWKNMTVWLHKIGVLMHSKKKK